MLLCPLNPKKLKKGFTIVEVLVALVLFLIIMVAGLSFFFYGRTDINLSGHYRQAEELASQKLEEVRALPYDEIGNDNEQNIIIGEISFTRITSVTEREDLEMKEVEIEVRWSEKGTSQEVKLKTVIAH